MNIESRISQNSEDSNHKNKGKLLNRREFLTTATLGAAALASQPEVLAQRLSPIPDLPPVKELPLKIVEKYEFGDKEAKLLETVLKKMPEIAKQMLNDGLAEEAKALTWAIDEGYHPIGNTLQRTNQMEQPYQLSDGKTIPDKKFVVAPLFVNNMSGEFREALAKKHKEDALGNFDPIHRIIAINMEGCMDEYGEDVVDWRFVGVTAHEMLHAYQVLVKGYTYKLEHPSHNEFKVTFSFPDEGEEEAYVATGYLPYRLLKDKGITQQWGKTVIPLEGKLFEEKFADAYQIILHEVYRGGKTVSGKGSKDFRSMAKQNAKFAILFHNRKVLGWDTKEGNEYWKEQILEWRKEAAEDTKAQKK